MPKTFTLHILLFFIIISSYTLSHNNKIECSICESIIKEEKYFVDIWGNPFHIKHENEGKFCECCSRIISQKITSGGYQLKDGRLICSLCDISIIKPGMEEESLKHVIKALYEKGLKGLDEKQIEIKTVDKNRMKKLYGNNASNHLKGMTQISINNKKIFSIYILNNIPKIQFEAILAHELMHVWLYKNNINLEHEKMEAFCNLGSYLIYKKDDTKFSRIHLMSFEQEKNQETKIYRILKSLMENTSFNYILKNIHTIDMQ